MTPRHIISFIARQIYRQQYSVLKDRIQEEYTKFQTCQKLPYNKTLERLLISGEDHRFRYHFGFDIIAILRAIRNRLFYNKIEGASTIEQQLVRVLMNDFEKNFKRKIKEIFLSTTLFELVPRCDIPLIYLNVAYYGTGMIGLEQILKKLNLYKSQTVSKEICAEIIARIKYPEPQGINLGRLKQIETRKSHLLSLYEKHNSYKHFKIYG